MQVHWDAVRHWTWRFLPVAVVLTVAVAGGSWWYFAPVPVAEHLVETGALVAEVMGTGTLEARVKSTISPKIAGRLQEIPVDQGDRVQAGQLLFTLDDAELKQQVEIAQVLRAVENGGAGGVSRRSNMAAPIGALLEVGKMGASAPIFPNFAGRPRSAIRHGVLERGSSAGADERVEPACGVQEVRSGVAYAAEDPGA